MSTQGAVQRVTKIVPASTLKIEASERLAAHRARRAYTAEPGLFGAANAEVGAPPETRASRIAAAVAERYAQTQSYRAFLAAEAERVHAEAERARAAAEVARRTAEAIAAVQLQLLEEIQCELETEAACASARETNETHESPQPVAKAQPAALTVRLYEVPPPNDMSHAVANAVPYAMLDEEERMALDEEIAFRQEPVFDDFQQAAVPLPANLIEFPRQLVAARKARPRLAEGPLRDEEDRAGAEAQLRIFEVEPELISTMAVAESSVPEWSSIRLSACAVTEAIAGPEYPVSSPHRPLTAPTGLRLMATLVDGCILLGALLGFGTVAAYVAGQVPTRQIAAISAAAAFAMLFLLYYLLCFSVSDATPGMRYARIGLCTLDNENPTRRAIRRRLIAMVLAACPLGLGFLWALIDDDGLGWHDRMSKMYPRSY